MWLVCASPFSGNTCRLKRLRSPSTAKSPSPLIHRLSPPLLRRLDDQMKACGLDPLEIGSKGQREYVYRPFGDTIAGMAILRLPPDYGNNAILSGRCLTYVAM